MYNFDAKKTKYDIVKWIRNWFKHNGPDCNAIIGISGGKDSSVVAALCVEALGADRVIGVLMPCGKQSDIDVARNLVGYLGIKSYEVNIKNTVDAVLKSISPIEVTEQTKTNLPARIRMATLYAIAQSNNGRVSNNCNLSEDWVGYSTRFGDDAGDFSPISKLTVTEVKEIGKTLGLPSCFIEKTPIDGLCGKTDEEKLGFSYEALDKYIRNISIPSPEIKEKIDTMHMKNAFKLRSIAKFIPKGTS